MRRDDLEREPHVVPVLGGADEDDLVRRRVQEATTRVDGPAFVAELTRLTNERRRR
jgi:hypothetical protein